MSVPYCPKVSYRKPRTAGLGRMQTEILLITRGAFRRPLLLSYCDVATLNRTHSLKYLEAKPHCDYGESETCKRLRYCSLTFFAFSTPPVLLVQNQIAILLPELVWEPKKRSSFHQRLERLAIGAFATNDRYQMYR